MARKGYSLGSLTDYVNTKFNISGGEVTGNLNVQGILSEKGERVFSPNNKPTATDVGLGNVPNTIHSVNADANTVVVRDSPGDINCRLLRSNYENQTSISGAMAYRLNNSSDNFVRFCSDPAAIRKWLGGGSQPATWATLIGTVPKIGDNGEMGVGKFIDFHDTNSTKDYDVRLQANSNSLNITTGSGTIEIGVQNTSYAHIYTDRAKFAFNKEIDLLNNPLRTGYMIVAGDVELQAQSIRRHYKFNIGSRNLHMYADPNVEEFKFDASILSNGNGNFNDVYIRSDKRLKSNITPLEDNLSKILHLNPVKYDKKGTLEAEDTEEELGLIAQEVEEIIPLAVATPTDEAQLKALKPYALIATLVGAVKELKAELDELKAQINQTK